MTVSVTTEKAIDGLARELFEWSAPGEAWDRATDNERANWIRVATNTMRLLGLVAIDPALYTAVQDAERACKEAEAKGWPVWNMPCGQALVDARKALLDAVLAQLGGR
jgi:hypothetical protein